MTEILTDDEHAALDLSGELANRISKIIAPGETAAADWAEACALIHNVQAFIMRNAAARAYPDRYRLLGGL